MNPDQVRQTAMEIAEEAVTRAAESGRWGAALELDADDRRAITDELAAIAEAVARGRGETYGHVVLIPDAAGRLQPNWDGELHTDRAAAVASLRQATTGGEQAVLAEVVDDRG